MTSDAMRDKIMKVANLLADLSAAVSALADEDAEVKTEEKVTEKTDPPSVQKQEKQYTMEDVRKVLAEKSSAGFTAAVRALLEKHGGAKLSAIDSGEYAAIIEEAKEIG